METKEIARQTFWYLLAVYVLIVILVSFDFIGKYSLHFEILAFVIGILGAFVLWSGKIGELEIGKKILAGLTVLALVLVFVLRAIPYLKQTGRLIGLGYDAGLYQYGIVHGLANRDAWILRGGMEPGFLYLMKPFTWLFSSEVIVTWIFIGFCVLLGLAIYVFAREKFGTSAGVIAVLIYAVSAVQYYVFSYLYYKNVIGLVFALFSMTFLTRWEKSGGRMDWWLFVVLGGAVGLVHRPTFYIFGLSYFVYAFVSAWMTEKKIERLKWNVLAGVIILLIGFSLYAGDFFPAITSILPAVGEGFVSPGESPGTFISFQNYQFTTLAYLPFAVLGLVALGKRKRLDMLFWWAVICGVIVYAQFFFFNRFIIHLDIALILTAAYGFGIVIKNKKYFGIAALVLLLVSSGYAGYSIAMVARPGISSDGIAMIERLNSVEENAYVMAISSEYSPWVLAYSGRETIAPGLFDLNEWDESEWGRFWTGEDVEELMESYSSTGREIYLFAGTRDYGDECFEVVYSSDAGNKIMKYVC